MPVGLKMSILDVSEAPAGIWIKEEQGGAPALSEFEVRPELVPIQAHHWLAYLLTMV
jgi:hypothetical protein